MLETFAPVLLAVIAAAGVAYALLYPLLTGEARAEQRRKALAPDMAARGARGGTAPSQIRNKRDQVAQSLKELDQREKARGKLTLEQRIKQAGLTIDRRMFYIFSAGSAAGFAFLGQMLTGSLIGAGVGLFVGALGVPRWTLEFLKNRRVKKFLIEFPNALDVMVRGLKSGLPLNDCVRVIASEAAEPVRGEFRAILDSQAIGLSLAEAIEGLAERIPVPETSYFGIIIAIQAKSGGNLAESLGNMSKVVRDRRKLRAKVQALSAEAKSSAGIIAAMPPGVAGMVYLTTPSYIEVLWKTQTGQFVLVGCAIWMLMGVLIMRKMINFEV
jgi:tight adherence protein B